MEGSVHGVTFRNTFFSACHQLHYATNNRLRHAHPHFDGYTALVLVLPTTIDRRYTPLHICPHVGYRFAINTRFGVAPVLDHHETDVSVNDGLRRTFLLLVNGSGLTIVINVSGLQIITRRRHAKNSLYYTRVAVVIYRACLPITHVSRRMSTVFPIATSVRVISAYGVCRVLATSGRSTTTTSFGTVIM